MKRVLIAAASVLGLASGAWANGLADLTSDGRTVAWAPHVVFILKPGQAAGPLPGICVVTPATILQVTAGLALYNGSYIMQGWVLDSNLHRWYFDEAAGCSDKGLL